MPINKYYKGHGSEVMANMKKEYGDKKGEQVFYATANKKGMNAEAEVRFPDHEPTCACQKGDHTCDCDKGKNLTSDKVYTEGTMTFGQKLLEAIRGKRWHDANGLFEQDMQARMTARIEDIKTRVYMEDQKRCELCGGTKDVKVLDDGTAICKECDVEECASDLENGIDKDMTKSPYNNDIGDPVEKTRVEDFGATKVCKTCKHPASEHGDDGCDHSGCKCMELTEDHVGGTDELNSSEAGDQTGGNVGPQN